MADIHLTLPDSTERDFPAGSNPLEVAAAIFPRLARKLIAAKYNGQLWDVFTPLPGDGAFEVLTFDSPEGREVYWHSSSHVLAQAVRELWPDVKLAIGPAIDQGFYYDFDKPTPFTPEDIDAIELKVRDIITRNLPIHREVLPRLEALERYRAAGEVYKVELLEEIKDDEVTIYHQGDFQDLCRGPHIPETGRLGHLKVLTFAGAYWRGSEHNPMLQRIYAISFPEKKDLDAYLLKWEEAKKRDHRRLGKELGLFDIVEEVGPGLVLWHPKGGLVRMLIEDFWRKQHLANGYQIVFSPHIGRSTLWEISGHLGFYKENMYAPMTIDEQEYFAKPMNCPFHIMIYKANLHSYRELPIRLAELGTVYRYERSGVLHGLLRVRGFTQDDAHIICTPEQIEEEVLRVFNFSVFMLKSFGFTEFETYVATRPADAVGTPERWDQATRALIAALDSAGMAYELDAGGGAFYGPKIDLKVKDALGRAWQCTTIQFDFNMSERFDMTYIAADGTHQRPYMVHRALLGSIERFFACLVEHFGGAFPVWLAPVQVTVLPITEAHREYAIHVQHELEAAGLRVHLDDRSEKVNYRIREAEMQKVPYMAVVGGREAESGNVAVRKHKQGDIGAMSLADFRARVVDENEKRVNE